MWAKSVDAEFEILRALGASVHPVSADHEEATWSPWMKVLLVPDDYTPEEAEDLVCEVLGMLVDGLSVGDPGQTATTTE